MSGSFAYEVPALGRKKNVKPFTVRAWKTAVPGLIIQETKTGNAFSITHEPSGFVIVSALRRATLEKKVKKLADFRIKWDVVEP
jgi:hypothetical protein